MSRWQDRLFVGLAKCACDATDFLQTPTGGAAEAGTQIAV